MTNEFATSARIVANEFVTLSVFVEIGRGTHDPLKSTLRRFHRPCVGGATIGQLRPPSKQKSEKAREAIAPPLTLVSGGAIDLLILLQ